jgi:centrosomal protein CEP97
MYGIARLHGLTTLNLANNNILTIEGLKDLVQLKWLCLAANSIKVSAVWS